MQSNESRGQAAKNAWMQWTPDKYDTSDLPEIAHRVVKVSFKVVGGSEASRRTASVLPLVHKRVSAFMWYAAWLWTARSRKNSCGSLVHFITSQVECLYFGADSDEGTIVNRALAVHIERDGIDRQEDACVRRGRPHQWLTACGICPIASRLEQTQHQRSMTLQKSATHWIEMFGRCPELIVVDNLSNIQAMHDNEWTGLRDGLRALHTLARDTLSAMLVLHHTSESQGQPTQRCHEGNDGQGQCASEVILTIAMDGPRYYIAAVKNSERKSEPALDDPVTVTRRSESMSLFNTAKRTLRPPRKRREWIG